MIKVSLRDPEVAARFRSLESVMSTKDAVFEAERCFYCYDAPCIQACPVDINIPGFIKAIAEKQIRRAEALILEENPLGNSCARVCPVEVLCESRCVRAPENNGPVRIGLLQRYAMEHRFSSPQVTISVSRTAGNPLEKRVAVVGAGPAGMSAAFLLAKSGVAVDLFDGRSVPGGLNESGVAAYKMLDDIAQREARFLLDSERIRFHGGLQLGKDLSLQGLRRDYDAVILAVGLGAQKKIGIPGEELDGVYAAVPFIASLRRGDPVPVGEKVVVLGGGMTAIDIAVQIRLLGASEVHLCYRRSLEAMPASAKERLLAQEQGVFLHPYLRPRAIERNGRRLSLMLQPTKQHPDGFLEDDGEPVYWMVDQVFIAVGQCLDPELSNTGGVGSGLYIDERGKIAVDAEGRTTLHGVWAAGDCASRSPDLTVHAVADAKVVVRSILHSFKGDQHAA